MTESRWEKAKPVALALVVGLVAGPYISNGLGWQVTSGTAAARMRAGIVEQLASVCYAQARTEVRDPSKLDQTARGELAKKWALMPGGTSARSDVTAACAEKLGRTRHRWASMRRFSRPSPEYDNDELERGM
jgi:hypothetical protein